MITYMTAGIDVRVFPDKKHVGTIKRTRSVGCTTRRAQVADLTMVWLM